VIPDLAPPNEAALAILAVPDELKQVLSSCTKNRGHHEEELEDEWTHERWNCDMTFGDDGFKVAVDMDGECMMGSVSIAAQTRSRAVPFELVSIGLGEFCDEIKVADDNAYQCMTKNLGLEETKPKHLLAALLLESLPAQEIFGKVGHDPFGDGESLGCNSIYGPVEKSRLKLLLDAFKLMKEATGYVP